MWGSDSCVWETQSSIGGGRGNKGVLFSRYSLSKHGQYSTGWFMEGIAWLGRHVPESTQLISLSLFFG